MTSRGSSVEFVIPGDPVGYVRMTRRGQWYSKPAQRFHAYCSVVRHHGAKVLALHPPTVVRPWRVTTISFFRNKQHPDPENVHKGIIDALMYGFKQRKVRANDKHIGGEYVHPKYDAANPRVEVRIET